MRFLLSICLLSPSMLLADLSSQGTHVVVASTIGGSGNFGEELIVILMIAGLFYLVSQWIKFLAKIKKLQAQEVLPNFPESEFVPSYQEGSFHLIPASFEEHYPDFSLFWNLQTSEYESIGRMGFLHYDLSKKAVQMSFEVNPEYASHPEIAMLLEKACAYLWTQWSHEEIQHIQAYIQESDLMGEVLLESLGFVETGNEDETLSFCLYRKER